MGSYRLWNEGERLHLSSLIAATGGGVVTREQLGRAMYLEQLRVKRVAGWLLGRAALPDTRCILADVSVFAAGMSREEASRELERAWLEWYGWCAPRFQASCGKPL